jgi:hypothetical protein
MSKDPAFLFYDGDASRDVSHMNRLQRGSYFDFIQAQRKFCSKNENNTTVLPDGIPVDTIKQILGKDFDECWPSLKLIMIENNGCYYISWLKKSIDCRESFCQKQREKIALRWNNRGNTVVLPPENENEIVIDNNNSSLKEGDKKGKEIIQEHRELTDLLLKRVLEIRQIKVDEKKKLEWDKEVRLMVERDNRSLEDIKTLINECHDMLPTKSGFTWKTNILSMSTLRLRWNEGKIGVGMNKISPEERASL